MADSKTAQRAGRIRKLVHVHERIIDRAHKRTQRRRTALEQVQADIQSYLACQALEQVPRRD